MFNLGYLQIQNSKIDDNLAISLAKAMENCVNIYLLDLQNNRIREKGFEVIISRVKTLKIALLYLQGGNKMSISNLFELVKLPDPIEPNSLEISTVTISGQTFKKVGILSLKVMCLSDMNLGDEGALVLARNFEIMPCMEVLFFCQNEIGEEGATAFAQNLPKARALRYFSLCGNYIPLEYVKKIETVNRNRAGLPLVEINLSCQRESDPEMLLAHAERIEISAESLCDQSRQPSAIPECIDKVDTKPREATAPSSEAIQLRDQHRL